MSHSKNKPKKTSAFRHSCNIKKLPVMTLVSTLVHPIRFVIYNSTPSSEVWVLCLRGYWCVCGERKRSMSHSGTAGETIVMWREVYILNYGNRLCPLCVIIVALPVGFKYKIGIVYKHTDINLLLCWNNFIINIYWHKNTN